MTWKARLAIRLCLAAGLATVLLARAAYGQGEAPAAATAPALTPPKLVTFVDAVYPEAALAAGQTAVVELELVLDAAGAGTDARVVAPVGDGFDEAALAAARQFGFEPARRNGEAIPARIRYKYVFEPKPAPAPPPTTGAIEGRVLLRAGDGIVRGADVELAAADGTVTRTTRTGADGSFQFGDLPKGRYHVRVAGQDLAAVDGDEDITAGDLTSVTYRLDPADKAPAGDVLEFGATATVEAPPREVTKRTLKSEELLRMAGTRGDALQAIEYMPGVGRGAMGFVIIRGSSPADSEVEFEGAPVYRLYHFGGLTSFVNSRMLERIDLYPGNFSARFGRKMGGIIDVGVRDPKSDAYHGMIDVNVIDASLLVEGPLGRHGSIAIAAKRSYIDFFIDKLLPSDIGVTAAPVYWDYQVIASFDPSERDHLRAMVYGSYDDFKLTLKNPQDSDPQVRGEIGEDSSFHRGMVSWKHKYSDAVEHEISTTIGPFKFAQNVGPDLRFDIPGYDVYTRAEWRANLHEGVRLIGGLDLHYAWFDVPPASSRWCCSRPRSGSWSPARASTATATSAAGRWIRGSRPATRSCTARP
jgi:TonB family protein